MKFLSNIKTVIGVLVLIFLGVIGYYFNSSSGKEDYIDYSNRVSETSGIARITSPEVNVPDGWNAYMGDMSSWQRGDLRIAFTYPSEWTMNEEIIDQKLRAVIVAGDGYSLRIDQAGRGMPRPYDYTQVIGGYSARVWKDVTDSGIQFTFGIIDADFVIHATIPNESERYLDQIISSVLFYK